MFYGGGSGGESLASIFRQFVNQEAYKQQMEAQRRQADSRSGSRSAVQSLRQQQHDESFSNIKEAEWSLIPPSTEC